MKRNKGGLLPYRFWKIVQKTPSGVLLANRKGRQAEITFKQLSQLCRELKQINHQKEVSNHAV